MFQAHGHLGNDLMVLVKVAVVVSLLADGNRPDRSPPYGQAIQAAWGQLPPPQRRELIKYQTGFKSFRDGNSHIGCVSLTILRGFLHI